ncbi:MAG: tetratricopeptide repeat protein [Phycisphaerae bacterium]|nr:tetratricopeptide repeat protein [Phycisphaerae bacterium]
MKKSITLVIILAAVAGCGNSVPEARQEAYKRWYHARARMLYGVAVEHFKVGQLGRASNRAQEALTLEADYHEARLLLGKVYIEQGHYAAAAEQLDKVRQDKPTCDEVHYLLAVAQEKQGRLEEALANYRRAYALDNRNIAPVMAAAEVLVALRRTREAQLYIESYIVNAGEEPGMYEIAGRLAMMQRQYDKAADYYEQALDLDCRNVRYREALARSQVFAGRDDKAVRTFVDLLAQKDYTPRAWVYTMLGDCYMSLGRPRDAKKVYQQASKLRPASPGIWTSIAKAALAVGDAPRAILSARQALQLDAGSLDATLVLGYALLRNRQVTRAVSVLNQATALHPQNGMLRCVMGLAYAAAGNNNRARQCYGHALRIEPENQLARELLNGSGAKELSKLD